MDQIIPYFDEVAVDEREDFNILAGEGKQVRICIHCTVLNSAPFIFNSMFNLFNKSTFKFYHKYYRYHDIQRRYRISHIFLISSSPIKYDDI